MSLPFTASKLLPVKAPMLQDVPYPKMAEITAVIPTELKGLCCGIFPYCKSSA